MRDVILKYPTDNRLLFVEYKLMPTIVTHAAVPLCLGLGLGCKIIPPRLLLAGVALGIS